MTIIKTASLHVRVITNDKYNDVFKEEQGKIYFLNFRSNVTCQKTDQSVCTESPG